MGIRFVLWLTLYGLAFVICTTANVSLVCENFLGVTFTHPSSSQGIAGLVWATNATALVCSCSFLFRAQILPISLLSVAIPKWVHVQQVAREERKVVCQSNIDNIAGGGGKYHSVAVLMGYS